MTRKKPSVSVVRVGGRLLLRRFPCRFRLHRTGLLSTNTLWGTKILCAASPAAARFSYGPFCATGVRQGALFFQTETMRTAFSFFTFPPHATHGLHEQLSFFGIQCGIIHVILRCPRVHPLFSPPFLRSQDAFFRCGGFFLSGNS